MPLNIKPSNYSVSIEEMQALEEKKKKEERASATDARSPNRAGMRAKATTSTLAAENNGQYDEEGGGQKKKDRFYLPVLYINDPTQWESKPLSERKHFTDDIAKDTCLGNCCNVEGLSAGCCQLDPDDMEHVLGPVDEEWIKATIKWFKKKDINVTRHDLVIDYEEGRLTGQRFFNDHEVFKRKDTYPILRIQASGIRFACKFLNVQTGKCTIYQQRPEMCRNYYCSYIKSNFLVKTQNHPNTYKKIG